MPRQALSEQDRIPALSAYLRFAAISIEPALFEFYCRRNIDIRAVGLGRSRGFADIAVDIDFDSTFIFRA